ncbi:hypothetical protein F5X68DRAFT_144825 [Plectosphaerella plurivora]|uniref:Ankyrin repeat protein n=1 Tax=Plectosphaerella plurivora TaxID=936078 RepID=A0A9P8V120_9PEZI|nr:hypothetical protein F5X68DRAFT_144825 [Plectosphaerella plurivora]
MKKLQQEYDDPAHELCYARAAGQTCLGKINQNEYFDNVLLHLLAEEDGGVRHALDGPPGDLPVNVREDLTPLAVIDPIAAAIKALTWTDDFKPLRRPEWRMLQGFTPMTNAVTDAAQYDQYVQDYNMDLSALSPEAGDILAVMAYARRFIDIFDYLLQRLPAPKRSTWDWLEPVIVHSRIEYWFNNKPESVETEARFWTLLLSKGWVHCDLDKDMHWQLMRLTPQAIFNPMEGITGYESPHADPYHAALAAKGFLPGLLNVGRFLLECPSLQCAKAYFSHFKPVDIAAAKDFDPSQTGIVLVGLVSWKPFDKTKPALTEDLRAEYIKLILEVPGTRIDEASRWCGWPRHDAARQDDWNALQVAAWLGDLAVGKLLVSLGADKKVFGEETKSAVEIARSRGHDAFAEWIEAVE